MPGITLGTVLGQGGATTPSDGKLRPGSGVITFSASSPEISKTVTFTAPSATAFAATAPTISGAGPSFLVRDQFTTTANPVVDGAAEPGPGTRDVTGTNWTISGGALFGGMQGTPVWGNSKIVYDGQTRADGLALWALVVPSDRDADLGIGWATSTGVGDPTTNGHHWLVNAGYGRVSQPGKLVTLSGLTAGTIGFQRTVEYLVVVVARAQGAFYLVSTFAPYAALSSNSSDPIGIPQYPDARVLWVDDTTTTTPLYPHISAFDGIAHGHWIDDLRVLSVSSWATDAGIATFLDRFTRADNATSPGGSWTVGGGTFGISSNKLYAPTAGFATAESGLPSGDGIFRGKITWPNPNTSNVNFYVRFVDGSNFIRVLNASASNVIRIDRVVANASTTMASATPSWVAGQTYEWTVIAKGNKYQVYVDGTMMIDWTTDATNSFLTEQTFGVGLPASTTGARWDDVMVLPHTVTLPTDIQTGDVPHVFTPGSTIASDTFTAANGTAISGRTPDTGSAWAVNGAGWEINTNRARNTNTNGAATPFFAFIDCGTTDVEWQATITTPSVDDVIRVGAVLRYTDASNYLVARLFMDPSQVANDEIEIFEQVGGVGQPITKQNIGNYYATSTAYTLKCQLVGSVLHAYLDGQPILSYRVQSITSGTRHGLYHDGSDDGSSFDQFSVKALT